MRRGRVLVALLALAGIASAGDLELLSIHGRGDPLALAFDAEESALVLADGCVISVRSQLDEPPFISEELRSTTLDATIFELAIDGDDLFVAGGAAGLFRVAWREQELPVHRIEGTPEGACTSVAVTARWLHATFTTEEGARWLVFTRDELRPVWDVTFEVPLALDVKARGDHAWIALGADGARGFRLPERVTEAPTQVAAFGVVVRRDRNEERRLFTRGLALGSDLVHLAASARTFSMPWRRRAPDEHVVRGAAPDRGGFAVRVAANEQRWFVARLRGPADVADGAPYGLAGVIGLDLEVGDVPPGSFGMGTEEWIESGSHQAPTTVLERIELPACGFRTLEAGPKRLYAQLLKLGARVWSCEGEELRELWTRRPLGHPLIDGEFSLSDPDVVLFGSDSQGSLVRGLLEVGEDQQLGLRATSRDEKPLGLRVGAQWLDEEHGCEWFLAGRFLGWQLVRFQPGADVEFTRWPLPPPEDPAGERGVTYFSSSKTGDLVLGTRGGSRHGLVGWSARELTEAALETTPGKPLVIAPRFQTTTHGDAGALSRVHTWSAALASPGAAQTVAVVPHGRALAGEGAGRSRATLYSLIEGSAPAPRAELLGGAEEGHAICAAAINTRGRALAVTGDLAGWIEVWDLAELERPVRLARWRTPPSIHDGRPDSILDLAFVGVGDEIELLAAAGRAGLVRFSLDGLAEGRLHLVQVLDTPGWAAGLAVQQREGEWRVLVGDQKCGARLYRWKPGAQKRK